MRRPPTDSSLDRFLNLRAAAMIGRLGRGAWKGQVVIGCSLVGIAAVLAAIGLITRTELTLVSIGPAMAGAINIVVGLAVKASTRGAIESGVRLTPEARSFVTKLERRRMGWRYNWANADWNVERYGPHRPSIAVGVIVGSRAMQRAREVGPHWQGGHSASSFLEPIVFDMLEEAAFEYNRTIGMLVAAHEARHSVLDKMTPSIVGALDDSMATLFHHASLLERFPESAGSTFESARQQVSQMKEVADRVDAMRSRGQTLTDRLEYATRIESVLEDLRLDQASRTELNLRIDGQEASISE